MAVSDGRRVTVVKDMGLVATVFDDRTLAALHGHLAIGHTRYSTTGLVARWRNAQPVYRDVAGRASSPSATTATWSTPRTLAEEAGHAARHGHQRQRPRGRADRQPSWPSAPRRSDDGRALERALVDGAAPARGRLLARRHGRGPRHRRARPERLPAAVPRPARATAGCWRRRAPALDIVGAHFVRELEPGEMVVIDATGVRSVRPFADERGRPQALPVRVRLLRPARHPPLRPERPPGPGPHGRAARRAGAGRGRHGDGRARVGPARGRGLRPAQRHPLRPGPGQEPLHRPHASSPRTRRCGRSACA